MLCQKPDVPVNLKASRMPIDKTRILVEKLIRALTGLAAGITMLPAMRSLLADVAKRASRRSLAKTA